jgi:hypothetical protein
MFLNLVFKTVDVAQTGAGTGVQRVFFFWLGWSYSCIGDQAELDSLSVVFVDLSYVRGRFR